MANMVYNRIEFDELKELYSSIRDIDRIIKSDSEDKIDEIINAIKNIDKKNFDPEIQTKIIEGYREALLKIYMDKFDILNKDIETPGGLAKNDLKNNVEISDNRGFVQVEEN